MGKRIDQCRARRPHHHRPKEAELQAGQAHSLLLPVSAASFAGECTISRSAFELRLRSQPIRKAPGSRALRQAQTHRQAPRPIHRLDDNTQLRTHWLQEAARYRLTDKRSRQHEQFSRRTTWKTWQISGLIGSSSQRQAVTKAVLLTVTYVIGALIPRMSMVWRSII
jgi:hypothetical protein